MFSVRAIGRTDMELYSLYSTKDVEYEKLGGRGLFINQLLLTHLKLLFF